MKKFLLSLAILLISFNSFSQNKRTTKQFKFEIDADHDKRTNEWTKNRITVTFHYYYDGKYFKRSYFKNGISKFDIQQQSIGSAFTKDKPIVFEGPRFSKKLSTYKIWKIDVETNGDDGFMIDAAKLKWEKVTSQSGSKNVLKTIGNALKNTAKNQTQKGTRKKFGVDGKKAWCLSTDPKDANGKWKGVVSKCYRKITFDVASGKATGSY